MAIEAMAAQQEMSSSALEGLLKEALGEVQALEGALVKANARVLFFRRRLRQSTLKEMAALYGGGEEESQEEADKSEQRDGAGVEQEKKGDEQTAAPAPKRARRQERPDSSKVCVACFNLARGKAQQVGHTYDELCQKPFPKRGRFAKKFREREPGSREDKEAEQPRGREAAASGDKAAGDSAGAQAAEDSASESD